MPDARDRSARTSSLNPAWCSRPGPARGHRTRRRLQPDERKLDVTAFTDQVEDKTTFLFPVTTNAADITALLQPRLDAVYLGSKPVSSLTELNNQLNDLFKVAQ